MTYGSLIDEEIYIVPMSNIITKENNIINFRKKFREIFESNIPCIV